MSQSFFSRFTSGKWPAAALSALFLMGAALYNGYPLLYADTGTYLASGFELETPYDRPITYGLFIRIFSLNGFSTWPVIFAQSFLLALVIYECFRQFAPQASASRATILGTLTLCCFTGVSWVSSWLIADVFTPVTILCTLLLLYGKHTRGAAAGWLFLLLLGLCTHLSHVLMSAPLFLLALLWALRARKKKIGTPFKISHALAGLLLCMLAFFSMGSAASKSRHVYLMGRLVETGVIDTYLADNCAKKPLALCRWRDSLPPDAGTFMFDSTGAFAQMGGRTGTKQEFDAIIADVFTSPKYLARYLGAGISGTLKQLVTINAGEGLCHYPPGSRPYERMKHYFPAELNEYRFSKQAFNLFTQLPLANFLYYLSAGISLLLLLSWRFGGNASVELRRLFDFLVLAYVVQCAVCVNFSTLANRFGCRVVWLFPLFLLMLWFNGEYRPKLREDKKSA